MGEPEPEPSALPTEIALQRAGNGLFEVLQQLGSLQEARHNAQFEPVSDAALNVLDELVRVCEARAIYLQEEVRLLEQQLDQELALENL